MHPTRNRVTEMAKFELKFVEPSLYNKGGDYEAKGITYADTGMPVTIDTDTAYVECEQQGKSAAINKWMADYEAGKMKLVADDAAGNYKEISFPDASSIGAQMIETIGIDGLQNLLKTLAEVYGAKEEKGNEDAPVTPPTSDSPTDDPSTNRNE